MKISELTRDELSKRLVVSLLNSRDNEDVLFNFPHIEKGSYALVAQVCVDEKNKDGKYTSMLTVTNDLLGKWDIHKDELFEMAMDNSRRMFPVLIEPLDNLVVKDSNELLFKADNISFPPCLLLTNTEFFNGAAAMFYEPEALNKIAANLKAKELYLLPVSTNHIFCVPNSELMTLDEYNDVLVDIIREFPEDEHLGENIMIYDAESGLIRDGNEEFAVRSFEDEHSYNVAPSVSRINHR